MTNDALVLVWLPYLIAGLPVAEWQKTPVTIAYITFVWLVLMEV